MSFLAKLEEDLKFARWAYANDRFEEGLGRTISYVSPASRSSDFLHAHAMLLFGLSRFTEAEGFYARVLELEPRNMEALSRRVDSLLYTGRRAEAAELIARGRSSHPDHGGLLGIQLCELLATQGQQAALAALDAEKRSASPCRNLDTAIETLRQKMLSLYDPGEIDDPKNLLGLGVQSPATGGYRLRDIYEQFESLGANCDFGFIQRMRGAEPLSLLRWTSITPANLVRLLRDDLVGYDEPSRYALQGAHEKEYMLYESGYDTTGHTGVNSADIPADEFLARLTRRQTFLIRKFRADLAAGNKIFLYKAKAPISDEDIDAIDRQLLRLGARRTMYTMPTEDAGRAGTIAFPSPTRAVGWLPDRPITETTAEWDRIVVAAYDHFQRVDARAA